MSKEKKITELNDKELEKVNGGFVTTPVTVTSYSFEAGDCFACDSRRVRVVYSRNNLLPNERIIAEISESNAEFHQESVPVNDRIFMEEFFVGNNVF